MPRAQQQQQTDDNYEIVPNNERTPAMLREIAQRTKLRTLADMSETEIRALEKLYGAKIIRPSKRKTKRVRLVK
jgi:hypothetical protein